MRFIGGGTVMMGRWERPIKPREVAVHGAVMGLALRAERLLSDGLMNRLGQLVGKPVEPHEAWSRWNVAQIDWSRRDTILFQEWSGFGFEVFPEFVMQIRFRPLLGTVDLEHGRHVDPSVLHRAWEMIGDDGVPNDPRKATLRKGWLSSYRAFGAQIARLGVCEHPLAQTRDGLARVLAMRRTQVQIDSYGVPRLKRSAVAA